MCVCVCVCVCVFSSFVFVSFVIDSILSMDAASDTLLVVNSMSSAELILEPAHDKTNKTVCAPSED